MGGADVLWCFRRSLTVELAHVRQAYATDDLRPWLALRRSELRSRRWPSTYMAGRLLAGNFEGAAGRTFCCLHRGQSALVVDLEGGDYDRLVLGLDDPARLRDELMARRAEVSSPRA